MSTTNNTQVTDMVWPVVLLVLVAIVGLKFLGIFPSWLFALVLAALVIFALIRGIKIA